MNIVLIGMMGSGKSTIGRQISKSLGWPFYDSDQVIEEKEKMTVEAIFREKGEPAFRAAEKAVIASLAAQDDCVLATGGGAPCHEDNWKAFGANSFVVWLKVKPETLYERLVRPTAKVRPLLKDAGLTPEKVAALLTEREKHYGRAHWTLETEGLTPQQSAEKIVQAFKTRTA